MDNPTRPFNYFSEAKDPMRHRKQEKDRRRLLMEWMSGLVEGQHFQGELLSTLMTLKLEIPGRNWDFLVEKESSFLKGIDWGEGTTLLDILDAIQFTHHNLGESELWDMEEEVVISSPPRSIFRRSINQALQRSGLAYHKIVDGNGAVQHFQGSESMPGNWYN